MKCDYQLQTEVVSFFLVLKQTEPRILLMQVAMILVSTDTEETLMLRLYMMPAL